MTPSPVPELAKLEAGLPLLQKPWASAQETAEHPEAAVLVALTLESPTRVLLGRRALHLPTHPGEVAFAGGKREREDASPWETALREASEEVGIAPHEVTPLGELEPLMTRTGFIVHPCVAAIAPDPKLSVDPAEFDSAFLPPLEVFANARTFRLERMFDGTRHRMVPHYDLGPAALGEQTSAGQNVWGVTAAILAMLVNVAYDAGLDLQRNWKETP